MALIVDGCTVLYMTYVHDERGPGFAREASRRSRTRRVDHDHPARPSRRATRDATGHQRCRCRPAPSGRPAGDRARGGKAASPSAQWSTTVSRQMNSWQRFGLTATHVRWTPSMPTSSSLPARATHAGQFSTMPSRESRTTLLPVGIGSVVLLTEALALGSSTPHEARVKKILWRLPGAGRRSGCPSGCNPSSDLPPQDCGRPASRDGDRRRRRSVRHQHSP